MQSDCDEARLLWFMTLSTHSIGNDHEIDEHRKKINAVIAIMLINGAHCDEN